jgi:putative transposase
VVDGLKGFPEAINAVFPQTIIQTCIVHLIRHSMDFASWKDRKSLVHALRTVYRAADAAAGQAALDALRKVLGAQSIRQSRRAGVAIGSS